MFEKYFGDNGKLSLMYDFYIYLFKNSYSFSNSRANWFNFLKDNVRFLSVIQLGKVVEAVNSNDQIYDNWDSSEICQRIEKEFENRKITCDFTKYPKFKCGKTD